MGTSPQYQRYEAVINEEAFFWQDQSNFGKILSNFYENILNNIILDILLNKDPLHVYCQEFDGQLAVLQRKFWVCKLWWKALKLNIRWKEEFKMEIYLDFFRVLITPYKTIRKVGLVWSFNGRNYDKIINLIGKFKM